MKLVNLFILLFSVTLLVGCKNASNVKALQSIQGVENDKSQVCQLRINKYYATTNDVALGDSFDSNSYSGSESFDNSDNRLGINSDIEDCGDRGVEYDSVQGHYVRESHFLKTLESKCYDIINGAPVDDRMSTNVAIEGAYFTWTNHEGEIYLVPKVLRITCTRGGWSNFMRDPLNEGLLVMQINQNDDTHSRYVNKFNSTQGYIGQLKWSSFVKCQDGNRVHDLCRPIR